MLLCCARYEETTKVAVLFIFLLQPRQEWGNGVDDREDKLFWNFDLSHVAIFPPVKATRVQ